MNGSSRPMRFVGVLAAVVGMVGYAVFGWRFGGGSDPLPTALGVVAAVVALAWTALRAR